MSFWEGLDKFLSKQWEFSPWRGRPALVSCCIPKYCGSLALELRPWASGEEGITGYKPDLGTQEQLANLVWL